MVVVEEYAIEGVDSVSDLVLASFISCLPLTDNGLVSTVGGVKRNTTTQRSGCS